MSLKDDVEKLKRKVDNPDELKSFELADKKVKSKKLPFKFRARRFYKQGRVLVIFAGANHYLDFKWGKIDGGLIKVLNRGEILSYNAYQEGAVYFHKRFPVVIIFEWRIPPVSGFTEAKVEEFKSRAVGGDSDKELAKSLGLSSDAQQIIIRAIKQEEILKDEKVKKKLPIGLLIIGGGIILFVLGKAFGVV